MEKEKFMQIPRINSFKPKFKNKEETENKQPRWLDNFYTKIKNSADLNDTVEVPRTIFKGYLAFMSGTALVTLGNLIKKEKNKGLKAALNILSVALIIFGTFSFSRPYIIKDSQKTENKSIAGG